MKNIKKAAVISAITLLIVYFLSFLSGSEVIGGSRLTVSLFYSGILLLLLGLSCLVRNSGLFKSVSYIGYLVKKSRLNKAKINGTANEDEELGSFADYVIEKYSNKWSSSPFFFGAGILLILYAGIYILN